MTAEPPVQTRMEPIAENTQNDSRQSAFRYYRLLRRRLLQPVGLALLSLAVALFVAYGLTDPSFTDSQRHTVFLLVFAVLLWVTESVPPFAVGLFIICFQLFAFGTPVINSQPEDAQKYLDSWSSSVIFLMLGGFFLAEAMKKTGIDRDILRLAISVFGRKPGHVLLGLMLTTSVLSMVMSNTATTAMMLAAVMPLLRSLGRMSSFSRAMMLGIPTAAAVGGMGTIIGSPPNAVAVGALEQAGITVSFLDWMLLGVPIALALCVGFWYALGRKMPWGESPVAFEFEMREEPDRTARVNRGIVLGTTVITLVLWLTSELHQIPAATVSAVPVALLTLTGVLEGRDVRGLPWDTLMLVAGGLALGMAIVNHGIAEHYLGHFSFNTISMAGLMLLFGYITVICSNIMSNTATASILIPIAGVLLGGRSEHVTIMIALSASAALLLPVSTPPNAIAFGTGWVSAREFRFGGVLIGLGAPILIILWVWILLTVLV